MNDPYAAGAGVATPPGAPDPDPDVTSGPRADARRRAPVSAAHGHDEGHTETTSPYVPNMLPAVAAVVVLIAGSLARGLLGPFVGEHPAVAAWITVFVAIGLQAFPFLMLGVVLAAMVSVLLPMELVSKLLPKRQAAAVPAAGLAGALLPGCECASVPLAQSLMTRGVPAGAALTFLLAAPAINPIVLVSTAVAFNGDWHMVLARFSASLLTSVLMGWWWLKWGREDLIQLPKQVHSGTTKRERFAAAVIHDMLHAGGFLVIGGAIAATISVLVPQSVLDTLSGQTWLSVLAMAIFAVVVAVCSEADAFIAASMAALPPTAKLAFMVVGPALDVKLFAMQVGTFGRRFAMRFAPMTFVVAVVSACVVGAVLL